MWRKPTNVFLDTHRKHVGGYTQAGKGFTYHMLHAYKMRIANHVLSFYVTKIFHESIFE